MGYRTLFWTFMVICLGAAILTGCQPAATGEPVEFGLGSSDRTWQELHRKQPLPEDQVEAWKALDKIWFDARRGWVEDGR